MPEPITAPLPKTAVAPTPAQEYSISQHPPSPTGRTPNPDLAAALRRKAGVVEPPATAQPKTIPSQPPKPATTEPAKETPVQSGEEKPAPHVKFISADDREPESQSSPSPAQAAAPESASTPEDQQDVPSKEDTAAMRALREAHRKLKHDFSEKVALEGATKKQISEYQAKVKSYEDRLKALESAEGRAKELEKQALTLDEQLRIANYTQHPEFHEKFVKPVSDAMQEGYAMVKELIVGESSGEARYGNESDFAEVLAQPNYAMMDKKAVELFGERMSSYVVEAAKKARGLQQAQAKAVKDAAVNSATWLKQQQERAAQERTQRRTEFDRIASSLAEKYPQLYKPTEGDKEAFAARQAGEDLAKLILEGAPEGMSSEQYLNNVAKVYHRAASFPMRELAITRLQAENEALKAKLAGYEGSMPDTSSRQTPSGVKSDAGGTIVTSTDALRQQMHESLMRRSKSAR